VLSIIIRPFRYTVAQHYTRSTPPLYIYSPAPCIGNFRTSLRNSLIVNHHVSAYSLYSTKAYNDYCTALRSVHQSHAAAESSQGTYDPVYLTEHSTKHWYVLQSLASNEAPLRPQPPRVTRSHTLEILSHLFDGDPAPTLASSPSVLQGPIRTPIFNSSLEHARVLHHSTDSSLADIKRTCFRLGREHFSSPCSHPYYTESIDAAASVFDAYAVNMKSLQQLLVVISQAELNTLKCAAPFIFSVMGYSVFLSMVRILCKTGVFFSWFKSVVFKYAEILDARSIFNHLSSWTHFTGFLSSALTKDAAMLLFYRLSALYALTHMSNNLFLLAFPPLVAASGTITSVVNATLLKGSGLNNSIVVKLDLLLRQTAYTAGSMLSGFGLSFVQGVAGRYDTFIRAAATFADSRFSERR
jgi:hypothetical protein